MTAMEYKAPLVSHLFAESCKHVRTYPLHDYPGHQLSPRPGTSLEVGMGRPCWAGKDGRNMMLISGGW